MKLAELPHFSFLSQSQKKPLYKLKQIHNKPHLSVKKSNPSQRHKKLSLESLESNLDSFIIYQKFVKNHKKCEISTSKTICINSKQNITSNSYHKSLKKIKHLIKSKNRAKFKLDLENEEDQRFRTRKIILETEMTSNLLFNNFKKSYFMENNCDSDLGAGKNWDQSLMINPFKNFIEILPGGKVIFISLIS